MRRFVVFCVSVMLTFASSAVLAQATYRWINPKTGETMITDTAPPGNAKLLDRKAAAEKDPYAGLSYAGRRAAQNFPVTLFTTSDCIAECQEARNLLNKRGIPFAEKKVESKQEFEELNGLVGEPRVVPVLKVGNQVSKGFLAEDYHRLFDLVGYPKTAPYSSKPIGERSK